MPWATCLFAIAMLGPSNQRLKMFAATATPRPQTICLYLRAEKSRPSNMIGKIFIAAAIPIKVAAIQ